MHIEIDYRLGQLGMDARIRPVTIIQRQAEFSMKRVPPELDIHTDFPQVEIDYEKCYESMGCKDPITAQKDITRQGRQHFLGAIGKMAEEGRYLAEIEKGHTIADTGEMVWPEPPQYNVALIPSVPPEISFSPGGIRIEYKPGDITYRAVPRRLEVDMARPKVDFYIAQKPYIKMKAVYDENDK